MSSRPPLNKDRVVSAAVSYADAHGIEALSMRRLARELGVEAMSLYNHVTNKDEILEEMVDAVSAEADIPADASDWRTALRTAAVAQRDVFVKHPWAANLSSARKGGGPAQLRRANWILKTLREAGLGAELVYHAYHVLEAYVLGFVVLQLSVDIDPGELEGKASAFLAELPEDEYPDFVRHVHQHIDPPAGAGGFELGLDLILDGLVP